jgi:hypothetical protein
VGRAGQCRRGDRCRAGCESAATSTGSRAKVGNVVQAGHTCESAAHKAGAQAVTNCPTSDEVLNDCVVLTRCSHNLLLHVSTRLIACAPKTPCLVLAGLGMFASGSAWHALQGNAIGLPLPHLQAQQLTGSCNSHSHACIVENTHRSPGQPPWPHLATAAPQQPRALDPGHLAPLHRCQQQQQQ